MLNKSISLFTFASSMAFALESPTPAKNLVSLEALMTLQRAKQACTKAELPEQADSIESTLRSMLPDTIEFEENRGKKEPPCLYCKKVGDNNDEENHIAELTICFNLGSGSGASLPGHLHAQIQPHFPQKTSKVVTLAREYIVTQKMEKLYDELQPLFQENQN